jgi:hypothetical protein
MLERTDAITNEVLEPITFVLAYPTVFTWPEGLEGFGKEEIKILGKHFSKYFDNKDETVSINLMKEWYEFKSEEAFKITRPS